MNERPPIPLEALQTLISQGCPEIAEAEIKKRGLKYKIINGKLVDCSNSTEAWLGRFITVSLEGVKDTVRKLANIQDEVLITGPTGVGKEIIAHALNGDREGKFLGINCAGLPEHLIESELFGHEKGSFTGAISTKQGLMKEAAKGTLFLDEIGELPLHVQGKFLRALQEKLVRPVGSNKEEEINCRIICATNKDLWEMCEAGTFRLDLFARISTFEIVIPPLVERLEDVAPIMESLDKGAELLRVMATLGIRSSDLNLSLNVRSIQQHVRRYAILGEVPKPKGATILKEMNLSGITPETFQKLFKA